MSTTVKQKIINRVNPPTTNNQTSKIFKIFNGKRKYINPNVVDSSIPSHKAKLQIKLKCRKINKFWAKIKHLQWSPQLPHQVQL